MNSHDPALLQLPGLLAAVVQDALKDGVPVWQVVGALETVKMELVQRDMAQPEPVLVKQAYRIVPPPAGQGAN